MRWSKYITHRKYYQTSYSDGNITLDFQFDSVGLIEKNNLMWSYAYHMVYGKVNS